jgi:hypothetical protein
MTRLETLVDQFHRRLAGWCVLRQSVAAVTLWAFIWGTAVVVLRATQEPSRGLLLSGLIGVPIALALATRIALKRLPDRTSVRALLDEQSGCGGLLMAGAERDLGAWNAAVPKVVLPGITWNYRRPLAIFTLSIAYLLLGFLLPIDRSALAVDAMLDISRETDRLGEQVRVLKEEKVLEPDRAETLRQKLEQVQSSSLGKDPAKTLEALDHLNELVHQAARKASEGNARQSKELAKLQAASEALKKAAESLDEKTTAALMAELAAMAQKAAAENELLKEGIDGELAAALAEGKLSPEDLAKLAALAQGAREGISSSAQKLYNAKLIDASQLAECKGDGKCDGKGLADFLAKNRNNTLREGLELQLGKGGVSDDGPGQTPLEFGDRSSENGAKFQEQALPPGDLSALKDSQLTGVSSKAPQRDPKTGQPTSGALSGATMGGGSANTGQVLPQHKGAVERYFERERK